MLVDINTNAVYKQWVARTNKKNDAPFKIIALKYSINFKRI
jgi:hypothetical protein